VGRYELISFKTCPFVQRSVFTLNEKGVEFDVTYVDLANKPEWLLAISPFGKAPVLRTDGRVLFELAVINEFIDEVAGGVRMLPADPLERAYHRAWIELANALMLEGYKVQMAESEARAREQVGVVRAMLGKLEAQVVGPYFSGAALTLMDAATGPALQRLGWAAEIAPELELFAGLPKVSAWREAVLARDAFKRSAVPELHELWLAALRKRAEPQPNLPATWLAQKAR
jgi:glutathione S-transferase